MFDHRNITKIDDISGCVELRRLDLKGNQYVLFFCINSICLLSY